MIERTEARFGMKPERLAADTAYGSAANLNWLVNEKQIAPHIPVIDKSKREDGTFSREDFTFDKERNVYMCPSSNILTTTGKIMNDDTLFTERARMIAWHARSKRDAARRCLRARSRAASMRKRAMWPVRLLRPRRSSNRAGKGSVWRCCSRT